MILTYIVVYYTAYCDMLAYDILYHMKVRDFPRERSRQPGCVRGGCV